jgi:hypothetical protein
LKVFETVDKEIYQCVFSCSHTILVSIKTRTRENLICDLLRLITTNYGEQYPDR